MKLIRLSFLISVLAFTAFETSGQTEAMEYIPCSVDFSSKLRTWDGFGFNYVEAAQTRDYHEYPQDYGGFSLLNNQQRAEIAELVFGEEGLDVDLVKMFLDPYHQNTPSSDFDHHTTTKNMLDFVQRGNDLKNSKGEDLDIITTLYGPPAWATRQKFVGGRDLDPTMQDELADYMIHWALFLRDQGLNVKYLSIHNEGEDFYRWDFEDGTQRLKGFDFNMYWPPEQVNGFIISLNEKINKRNIPDLKVTNGEPSNWTRFHNWGYARALYENEEALINLGLLTTHGFINGDFSKLSYGTANSLTTDLLRSKKPGLHAWVTSFSWGNMDSEFFRMIHENIYSAKVNAVIPWAGIQNPSQWIDGDPNPGTAIIVNDQGEYKVTTGYYLYKQMTKAGHKGMNVVQTASASPQTYIIGFSGGETGHPDAFVVNSTIFIWKLPLEIEVKGTGYKRFKAFRTTQDGKEHYVDAGVYEVDKGKIFYDPPFGSVTTFIGIE